MTATVTLLRRCQCGAPGFPVVIEGENGETVRAVSCDACLAEIDATLTRVRPVFETMLACGIPKDDANETMTYLLGRIAP